MKINGVNGDSRYSAAAAAWQSSGMECEIRSPTARLPTWSWFCSEATNECPSYNSEVGSTGAPQSWPRNVENPPSWMNTLVRACCSTSAVPKSM